MLLITCLTSAISPHIDPVASRQKQTSIKPKAGICKSSLDFVLNFVALLVFDCLLSLLADLAAGNDEMGTGGPGIINGIDLDAGGTFPPVEALLAIPFFFGAALGYFFPFFTTLAMSFIVLVAPNRMLVLFSGAKDFPGALLLKILPPTLPILDLNLF